MQGFDDSLLSVWTNFWTVELLVIWCSCEVIVMSWNVHYYLRRNLILTICCNGISYPDLCSTEPAEEVLSWQHWFSGSSILLSCTKWWHFMMCCRKRWPIMRVLQVARGEGWTHLLPVPLTILRLNSKFDQILQCSGLKCTLLITTKFCTCQDSVTVVTCAKFCCDRLSIF